MSKPSHRLLLIEHDEPMARFVTAMVDMSTETTYSVTQVASLADGKLAYHAEPHDLILLDLGLHDPGDDLSVLRESMSWVPEPCVVVFTSQSAPELGLEALREGAHDFLLRSTVTPPMLDRVLGYAIERHKRRVRRQDEVGALRGKMDNLEAYVASVSHDLRSPLSTAVTMLSLVRDRHQDLESEQLDVLMERIHGALSRGLQFADDLLEDARRGEEGRRALDLTALASEAVDLAMVPDAVTVVIDDFPEGVWGRPAGMRQMLTNLIANAARFAGNSGRLRISGEDLGSSVRLMVEDDGPGVPEAERKKIFSHGVSGSQDHTGIGLSTVERQAAVHGGRVWVDESPTLGGARFTVELPMRMRKQSDH